MLKELPLALALPEDIIKNLNDNNTLLKTFWNRTSLHILWAIPTIQLILHSKSKKICNYTIMT